jgi:hypothetical protein
VGGVGKKKKTEEGHSHETYAIMSRDARIIKTLTDDNAKPK